MSKLISVFLFPFKGLELTYSALQHCISVLTSGKSKDIFKQVVQLKKQAIIITIVMFFAIIQTAPVQAQDLPYDQNEVQKMRAFLVSPSMEAGKTNADLLGMDINNPGTWAKWGGNDWFPRPPAQHAVEIKWEHHSFAGSLDISGFGALGYFVLDCNGISNFNSITISNCSLGWGLVLKSVITKELRITDNEGLGSLWLAGKVDVLTLQTKLGRLETNTLGNIPPDLAKFTELTVLKLTGISNIGSWKLANYPHLKEVTLNNIANITSLEPVNCPELEGIGIDNMPDLKTINLKSNSIGGLSIRKTHIKELDLTGVPNLVVLHCELNWDLTSLKITDKPLFEIVEVKGNPVLRSLEFSNLPKQEYYFEITDNTMLTELVLKNIPQLREIKCIRNGLTSLDVSGLPALTGLSAFDNQLTKFNASGIVFESLDLLWGNKLSEVSANVGGHNIHLKAYGKGGYVRFAASPGYWKPYGIELKYGELLAPYNTDFVKAEGTGFPPDKNDWFFLLDKNIDATFYFKAEVHLMYYFEDPDEWEEIEDEYGNVILINRISLDYRVGDPFVLPQELMPPTKTGFECQGWYTDSTLTNMWTFGKDTLRGELTLYPRWIPKGMPVVFSVKRQSPTDENTSADHVNYLVTFSKTVSGVDVTDFALTTTGTVNGTITTVSASSGNTVSVTVNNISGKGTLRLDVKSSGTGIVDSESNPLAGGYSAGEIFSFGSTSGVNDDPFPDFALSQNYPNPFNPTTVIKYQLPKSGVVKISVYDIFGVEVLKLVNEEKSAGYHEVRFDASSANGGLASGVYFYRIEAGSFNQTRKMLLLK